MHSSLKLPTPQHNWVCVYITTSTKRATNHMTGVAHSKSANPAFLVL